MKCALETIQTVLSAKKIMDAIFGTVKPGLAEPQLSKEIYPMDTITLDDLRKSLLPEAKEKSEAVANGGFLRGLIASRGRSVQAEDTEQLSASEQQVMEQAEVTIVCPLDSEASKSEIPEPFKPSPQQELAGRETNNKVSQFEPAAMINEIFQPVKPFQEKLAQLAKALEPIAYVKQLPEAFDNVWAFKENLATVVEPFRKLEELEGLVQICEPMRIFRDQIVAIRGGFASKTAELARTLEPLNKLRMQLEALAETLGPVTKLYGDLNELCEAFTENPRASIQTTELLSMLTSGRTADSSGPIAA